MKMTSNANISGWYMKLTGNACIRIGRCRIHMRYLLVPYTNAYVCNAFHIHMPMRVHALPVSLIYQRLCMRHITRTRLQRDFAAN